MSNAANEWDKIWSQHIQAKRSGDAEMLEHSKAAVRAWHRRWEMGPAPSWAA